jgi:uncharacterized repeat protein (TIGR03803 family)
MKHKSSISTTCGLAITIASLILTSTARASRSTETTLYSFQGGSDGCNSFAGVVFDKEGNLYGTTQFCGEFGAGTVFELTPPATQGGAWTEAILHSFDLSDGEWPTSRLILDSKGALYGETLLGGHCTLCGTVFKLTPPAIQGDSWTETTIYEFCPTGNCVDGSEPSGGLVFDKKGNLYGTTQSGGGALGAGGVVFELTPPHTKQGAWTQNVLYSFAGEHSAMGLASQPEAGVIFDAAGNLYGTSYYGGNYSACGDGCGSVFELSPAGGAWAETVLYMFQNGPDGAFPAAGLIFDESGALYGTTSEGFVTGLGNVFKLAPPAFQGGTWTESVLHGFQGVPDGSNPDAGVIFDGKNLYGTTLEGGTHGWPKFCSSDAGCGGTIFQLTPPKTGTGAWTETVLWNFGNESSSGGANPASPLFLKGGALYGTTSNNSEDCQYGCGAVFEIVP